MITPSCITELKCDHMVSDITSRCDRKSDMWVCVFWVKQAELEVAVAVAGR